MERIKNSYFNIINKKSFLEAKQKTKQLVNILEKEGFKKLFSLGWINKSYKREEEVANIHSIYGIPLIMDSYVIISIDNKEGINSDNSLIKKIDEWAK